MNTELTATEIWESHSVTESDRYHAYGGEEEMYTRLAIRMGKSREELGNIIAAL